jgi:kynurenine 3-monooxygenase
MASAAAAAAASPDNAVTIVGAGLAGSLMALILQRSGYSVTIYERYNDVRQIPSAGRSINLVLTSRGLRAMHALGDGRLVKDMYDLSVPVTGRVMHQVDGSEVFQRYGKDDSEFNLSISRYELNIYLMNRAEEAGATIHFGHALSTTDFFRLGPEEKVLRFALDGGKTKNVVVRGPIIAADGAGSRVRYALRDAGVLDFTEDLCVQGYKEIQFPRNPGKPGGYNLQREGLHIWPRTTHFLMALANLDGSFTGTIYVDRENDPESFAELNTPGKIEHFFQKHYADAIPVLGGMPEIVRQMKENNIGILGTVRATSYNLGGHCVLLGDSAHAITPFFGQGTNASFEDCLVLFELMSQHAPAGGMTPDGLARAFDAFSRERKPNADAIAEMALDNFVEMRDRVGDADFLLKKSVENLLENTFEDRFRSRYAMVCYGGGGGITYDAALRLGEVQWGIIEDLVGSSTTDASQIDLGRAERLIQERLVPLQEEMGVDLTQILHSVDDLQGSAAGASRL